MHISNFIWFNLILHQRIKVYTYTSCCAKLWPISIISRPLLKWNQLPLNSLSTYNYMHHIVTCQHVHLLLCSYRCNANKIHNTFQQPGKCANCCCKQTAFYWHSFLQRGTKTLLSVTRSTLCQRLRIVFGDIPQDIHSTLMNKGRLLLDLSHKGGMSLKFQPNKSKYQSPHPPK